MRAVTTDAAQDPRALIEAYYDAGYTDGLPVVPPSDASIEAMLAAGGFRGDEVIGEIAGRNTVVTADKVAINAVMAGCRPEYLGVVVAAIRGLCHPDFAYHGPASSTGGSAMVLIVNGPVARRLGINSGNNAFGQGHRPNATIGRAVRLTMMNVMNTRPGLLDRATLGTPGKYSFCFAEHEEDHLWEPLHVARGLRPEDSAVTLYASNSLYQVYNQLAAEPEPLLHCFADALCNLGSPNVKGFNQSLLVLAGEHAAVLRAAKWSRRQVQDFLVEHARRRLADLKRARRLPGAVAAADETTWRHVFERPEDILIVFAGGRAGSWSACLPGWGNKWTRAVTTRIGTR
ncbi:MAG TPA: hypothetical protein VFV05_20715 [Methylomirabilota bacterium]|nr:hypothetical protein [Methylomirabilota bacterium]